ncbi:hypothetical protein MKEN_00859800 [Mycena kentingensis (nom. inval.)]|nr:hypothetical protein MKEN_00859800 [Mycena kentingensis (nom. inval.)]
MTSKGDGLSEKLDTPTGSVEKAQRLWTRPFYSFIAFFSPADAIPPADDPKLAERVWGLVPRLWFLYLSAACLSPPTDASPTNLRPSTFVWLNYPMLLFAIVNTKENCGESLPMCHTILALGLMFCASGNIR